MIVLLHHRLTVMQATFSSDVGFEFKYIPQKEQQQWWQQRIEEQKVRSLSHYFYIFTHFEM